MRLTTLSAAGEVDGTARASIFSSVAPTKTRHRPVLELVGTCEQDVMNRSSDRVVRPAWNQGLAMNERLQAKSEIWGTTTSHKQDTNAPDWTLTPTRTMRTRTENAKGTMLHRHCWRRGSGQALVASKDAVSPTIHKSTRLGMAHTPRSQRRQPALFLLQQKAQQQQEQLQSGSIGERTLVPRGCRG